MPSPPPPRQRAPASPPPSSGPPPTPVATGPIPDGVLRAVLAADEAMYPAALPWARLRAWVDACPALAVCFYHHREDDASVVVPLGASITLPLRAGPWRALLAGRLAEPAIAVADLAVPKTTTTTTTTKADQGKVEEEEEEEEEARDHDGVGLHVFHVERFDVGPEDDVAARRAGRGLAARALRHACDVAAGRGWRVLGCSALTATDAGARAFAKLGFEPTGYEEIWVREAGGSPAAPARMVPILPSGPAAAAAAAAGGEAAVREKGSHEEVVGAARMVVRYSDGVQDGAGLMR